MRVGHVSMQQGVGGYFTHKGCLLISNLLQLEEVILANTANNNDSVELFFTILELFFLTGSQLQVEEVV
jgi:hypothetical protein